jgi:hypothetical protein
MNSPETPSFFCQFSVAALERLRFGYPKRADSRQRQTDRKKKGALGEFTPPTFPVFS